MRSLISPLKIDPSLIEIAQKRYWVTFGGITFEEIHGHTLNLITDQLSRQLLPHMHGTSMLVARLSCRT